MTPNIPEERSSRIGWCFFAIMGNSLPPRDPDEEDRKMKRTKRRTATSNLRSCASRTRVSAGSFVRSFDFCLPDRQCRDCRPISDTCVRRLTESDRRPYERSPAFGGFWGAWGRSHAGPRICGRARGINPGRTGAFLPANDRDVDSQNRLFGLQC